MTKVNKIEAKKIYNEGGSVHLLPSKVGVGNLWIHPIEINKEGGVEFQNKVNDFAYYSCNKELGQRINYYA